MGACPGMADWTALPRSHSSMRLRMSRTRLRRVRRGGSQTPAKIRMMRTIGEMTSWETTSCRCDDLFPHAGGQRSLAETVAAMGHLALTGDRLKRGFAEG